MRRILDEVDIDIAGIVMTVMIFLIGAMMIFTGITIKQEEMSHEPERVSHVADLNAVYDIKVLKTLGSDKILVARGEQLLKCETPKVQEFDSKSPIRCSDGAIIDHK